MTKERRLGRGLEALLSRVAGDREPTPAPKPPETTGSGNASDVDVGCVSRTNAAADSAIVGCVSRTNDVGDVGSDANPTSPADNAIVGWDATPTSGETNLPPSPPTSLPIDRIDSNPFQPRQDFDEEEMESLRQSLLAHGLLQPVVVRAQGDRYQLVAGERRLRAAAAAGWTEVPIQLMEADDRQMAELAIVENMQRKDLNALEKAASFQRYLDQYGCTQEELAGRLKLDRSTIANLIRLLELPQPVQDAIRQGKITPGHARALLPLGDEQEQVQFAERIQREGMSVRQTERLVQETVQNADAEPLGVIGRDGKTARPARIQSEHLATLEQEFKAALGTKVQITHSGRGRGKLVVFFSSHEEFERLRLHICGTAPAERSSQVG